MSDHPSLPVRTSRKPGADDMNSMPSTIAAARATARAPAPTALPHVPPDTATGTTSRSVALDSGQVLRIHDGRGLRVTPATGALWITEENSTTDTVLLAGETHRIACSGLTLMLAHRPSIVLLELAAGAARPRRIDSASADGAPGRRVWLGRPPWRPVRALARAARRLLRHALGAGSAPVQPRRVAAAGGGRFEHDTVHSTWLVRHTRRGLGAHESLPSARHAFARDLFFPYY